MSDSLEITTRAMTALLDSLAEQQPAVAQWAREQVYAGNLTMTVQPNGETAHLTAWVGDQRLPMIVLDLRAIGVHVIDGEMVLVDPDPVPDDLSGLDGAPDDR